MELKLVSYFNKYINYLFVTRATIRTKYTLTFCINLLKIIVLLKIANLLAHFRKLFN